jgi:tripartite-type tricarboxylate transporter receptor subunit TctC
VARLISGGLEQELGTTVNVVNRVGAGGVIAHAEIAKASPDGYTIGLATTELSTYYWGATGDITWKGFTPIALVNFDPSAIHVNATSEWKAAKEVIEAIRGAKPGTYKMSGVPIGGAAHLAFGGLLHSIGVDPNKVVLVPTRLTTLTVVPSSCSRPPEISRATASVPPPAAQGTISVIGRSGYLA